MLIVKSNTGSLGTFLLVVLGKLLLPVVKLDYRDALNPKKYLRTGDYFDEVTSTFEGQRKNQPITHTSHDQPVLNGWLKEWCQNKQIDTKQIYVSVTQNFVEHRVANILRHPQSITEQNQIAVDKDWPNYKIPVALTEAVNIFKMHKGNYFAMQKEEGDVVFEFHKFFIEDKLEWCRYIHERADKLGIKLEMTYLKEWYHKFYEGQRPMLERSKMLYDCVKNRKFVRDLNENEKGIVLGYCAVEDDNIDVDYLQTSYFTYSVY